MSEATQGYNQKIKVGLAGNPNHVKAVVPPLSSVMGFHKSFGSVSSGTATTDTTDKLIDSGATFQSDGVAVGMYVYNVTDGTWGVIESVDSETQLTIAADTQAGSATTDVFPDGDEAYVVRLVFELSDSWVEMNGQTLSDSDSPYNSQVIPDWNGSSGTARFLKGGTTSGDLAGSETHTHSVPYDNWSQAASMTNNVLNTYNGAAGSHQEADADNTSGATSTHPSNASTVWIMRVK